MVSVCVKRYNIVVGVHVSICGVWEAYKEADKGREGKRASDGSESHKDVERSDKNSIEHLMVLREQRSQ